MDDLHSAVHGVAAAVVSFAVVGKFSLSVACGLGICGRMVLRCLLGHRRKVGA